MTTGAVDEGVMPQPQPRPRAARRRIVAWPALADSRVIGTGALIVAGLWPLIQLLRLAAHHGHYTYVAGDQALMELAARRAWHLDQLVGPYSRYGWHHPGPALFYALALPVRVFGSGPGLSFGTVLINGAAAVAVVAVVWRRFGARAALCAAVIVDGLCLSVSIPLLEYPWNPYLIVVPILLFVVLCAAGALGHPPSLVWAALVGSYVLQTHISAAPYCLVMIVATVISFAVRIARGRDVQSWRTSRVATAIGVVLLVAAWVPPIVELARDHPNNLRLMWDFFTTSHPTPSLHAALHGSLYAVTVMPFTYGYNTVGMTRPHWEFIAEFLVLAVLALSALEVARRRRQWHGALITLAGALGFVVGVLATARAAGGVMSYLVVWQAFVPAAILLGLAVALFGPSTLASTSAWGAHSRRALNPLTPLLAAVGIGAAVITPWTAVATFHTPLPWAGEDHLSDDAVGVVARASLNSLQPRHRWVKVTIADASTWPVAAGLVLELDRHGYHTVVAPKVWKNQFGHEQFSTHAVDTQFTLYNAAGWAAAQQHQPLVRALASAGGVVLVPGAPHG